MATTVSTQWDTHTGRIDIYCHALRNVSYDPERGVCNAVLFYAVLLRFTSLRCLATRETGKVSPALVEVVRRSRSITKRHAPTRPMTAYQVERKSRVTPPSPLARTQRKAHGSKCESNVRSQRSRWA